MSDFYLLLEEQLPSLMRYATALTRDRETAGELIEDTVREALANRRQQAGAGDIRVRLFTILHDLRDNPFRATFCTADALDHDSGALLTLSDLDRALGQLPEEQRAVILLIGLEGMSYSQTAAILRITVGTLRSRLIRARERLRRAMDGGAPRQRAPRAA
jgi:RNA polymerase sigma-70 factor, ECF subfamily